MSKLVDIKGYWNMFGKSDFNDNDMWIGEILLYEDGWFEGIATDPNSPYNGDRFIFGVYHPEKLIELYKFAPISVSAPFVFHGKRDAKGYDGVFERIELFGSRPRGVSQIITQYAEAVRGNIEEETNELEKRIQGYKQSIMDATCKEFYVNAIAMRNRMCQLFLRNYEGIEFSLEETQQIMEEWQPVNDRVMNATTEEAIGLIKKMTNYLPDDDDDLPYN